MVIATFGPTSAWVGRTITYDDGRFTLQDLGPIRAADVLEYDRHGHLVWAYAGLREWVVSLAAPAAQVPPAWQTSAGAAPGQGPLLGVAHPAPAQARKGMPGWVIALIVVAVVGLVAVPVAILVGALGWQHDVEREATVREGIHSLQVGVQAWAVDHGDIYPDPSVVNEVGLADYVTHWPANPYIGGPMTEGAGAGQFGYAAGTGGTSFVLVGYGKHGPVVTVP